MIILVFFLVLIGATCKSPEMVAVGCVIGSIEFLVYFINKVKIAIKGNKNEA